MSTQTHGRSATEIRDAHRLHEALTIALAPEHDRTCPTRESGDRSLCDCRIAVRALACMTITRHAPRQATHYRPCREHAEFPILRDVPGFRCPDCDESLTLRCRQDDKSWPCDEVNQAMQATGLTTVEVVDRYLDSIAATA